MPMVLWIAAVLLSFLLYPALGTCANIPQQFVIGSWIGPQQTEAQYRLYREAGFNTLLDYPWEGDDYTKTLSLAEKAGGLSVILNIDHKFLRYKPERFVPYERISKFVQEVKSNKRLIGYFNFDEPFEKDADLAVETLKHLRSLDAGRLTWANFYPFTTEVLARSITSKSKPAVISTCYYPYTVKDNKLRLEKMYPVLEFYRSLSLEQGTPLWLFVQSVAQIWPPNRNDDMRMPTASEMRMQVYTNLAYGAKGLWYYTYAMPRSFRDISAAILDRADKPTSVYDSVKQLNKEVSALGPLLMGLTSVDVMHVGSKLKEVKSFVPNDLIAGIDGDNLLVGLFKDASGGDYFLLVNKLADRANKNVRLKLPRRVTGLSRVDRVSGRPVKYPVNSGSPVVNLEPGDGVLFRVN